MSEISQILKESYELPNCVIESAESPKITVRTSAYNHAPYIKKCIEGVLMQETNFQIEYIIGEDFSTDGTREIVFNYAKKYPEIIRVITADRNVGMKANNYRCRKAGRGEFTALCEGDDYWTDPKKLQKQIDLLSQYPECDLCFHPAKINYVDAPVVEAITGRRSNKNCIIPVKEFILNNGDFCPTASIVYRSRINEKLGEWYLNAPVGDYFFQILGAEHGGALYLNEVMSVYNKGTKNSWNARIKNDFERYRHVLEMCSSKRIFDEITEYRHHKWLRKRENRRLLNTFIPVHSGNQEKITEIKKIVAQHFNRSVRWRAYVILMISFFYHKLKGPKIKSTLMKLRSLQ